MFFKSVDEKLKKIGFEKINEDKYGCRYCRHDDKYNYTQIVNIASKANGELLLWSYDADLFDNKKIGNICVGLTYYEMKLFMKKMRKIGLASKN